MREAEVIARLRRMATAPEARGLLDDVAVLDGLVITHDSIAEGIHFLPTDPPASVGWKLVAVNLSDLAAKGATPRGALLSLTIAGTGDWEELFLSGVEAACESYALPLIGGDTISLPPGAPRVLGHDRDRTSRSAHPRPRRGPARRCAVGHRDARRFRGRTDAASGGLESGQPVGRHLSPADPAARRRAAARAPCPRHDGRFRRAAARREAVGGSQRMRRRDRPRCASAVRWLSVEFRGNGREARLFAATAGDDYALLAALPAELDPSTLSLPDGTTMARVGSLVAGDPSIAVVSGGHSIKLPEILGFEHKSDQHRPASGPPMADRP